MKTSVVIPTYNRRGLAKNLKKQILKFTPEVEVIIIDQSDSSTPNTSQAKNQGIAQAVGDVIIFFDDDVEITPNTIKAHLLEYKDPQVLAVAGRVINDGEAVPKDTDVETGEMNSLGTSFVKNFWGEKRQSVVHPYGCNWSVRKSVLKKVGGFDILLPPPLSSFEEIDLGLRVSQIGLMIFSPKALVYHHRAPSGGTRVDRVTRNKLYYQSYGRLIKKHIKFPLFLVSIAILKIRILKEAPYSLISFTKGLFS